jgi:hypothetical protein
MRFIPAAYREGCDRVAPWFSEKTDARLELDTAMQTRQQRPKGSSNQVAQEQDEDQDDPTALRYAAEHKRLEQPVRPVGTRRPDQLSLFGGEPSGPPAGTPHGPILEQTGGAEAPAPPTSPSVTKPPVRGGRNDTARPDLPAVAGIKEAEQGSGTVTMPFLTGKAAFDKSCSEGRKAPPLITVCFSHQPDWLTLSDSQSFALSLISGP